mgnify:CR=1 FL=1
MKALSDIGLGYLTLGEATPTLSGGEAQRLKLASEMGRSQKDTVFVFDEPTIGLHPSDVRTLVSVFDRLLDSGATVVVIEHDLDMIRNADYIIDMGPEEGRWAGRSWYPAHPRMSPGVPIASLEDTSVCPSGKDETPQPQEALDADRRGSQSGDCSHRFRSEATISE